MAGSLRAAMATIRGKKAAPRSGGLFVFVPLLLAGCGASPPEAAMPPGQTWFAAAALQPAALRLPGAETLMGLGIGELLARLGEPDLRRAEPPAELWQYRSADCVLEVILYAEAGTARVIGSEIYARGADGTAWCPSLGGPAKSRQSRL
jgi:hypothetical protein